MAQPLDLRGLEPPEPLLRILAAIDQAQGRLLFRLSREPFPLYPLVTTAGWRYEIVHEADSVVLVLTRRGSGRSSG